MSDAASDRSSSGVGNIGAGVRHHASRPNRASTAFEGWTNAAIIAELNRFDVLGSGKWEVDRWSKNWGEERAMIGGFFLALNIHSAAMKCADHKLYVN